MNFSNLSTEEKANITKVIDKNISKLNTLEENHEDVYYLCLKIADSYISLKEWSEALYYILRAEIINSSYEVCFVLGYIFFHQHNFKKSLNYFKIASNKPSPERQFEIFQKKDLIEHIESEFQTENIFDFLLENQKSSNEVLSKIHDMGASLDYTLNQTDISSEIKSNPGNTNSLHSSIHYMMTGETDKAIIILNQEKEKFIKKYPQYENLSFEDWIQEFPNIEEQIQQQEYLIDQEENLSVENYMKLGRMYFVKEDYNKAKHYFMLGRQFFIQQQKI